MNSPLLYVNKYAKFRTWQMKLNAAKNRIRESIPEYVA